MEIKVPAVGESITEATIAEWQKKDGDFVNRDEVLLVLETDKASVEVVAEGNGKLSTKASEGDVVQVGSVIGEIDTSATADSSAAAKPSGTDTPKEQAPSVSESLSASAPATSVVAHGNGKATHLSPAVRRVVDEYKLDPKHIQGTGKDGRLTKSDAMGAVSGGRSSGAAGLETHSEAKPSLKQVTKSSDGQDSYREPMTNIRRRIAERLVQAQQTAAILTTFNEIDMSAVMDLRHRYKDSFKEKYGIGLGFMGFFVKASLEALKSFPKVNAYIDGKDIVYHNYHNIGIAVGTPKGLVVPVIRNVEHMSLAEIELSIREFALKARDGKISVDDLSGGTFTISNGGVYGSLMSTPILNPPQSGILGMHKIEERPIAIKGQVVVRPMMYVALSYDHRIVDGAESVSFLVRIKECIEDPARLLLEI